MTPAQLRLILKKNINKTKKYVFAKCSLLNIDKINTSKLMYIIYTVMNIKYTYIYIGFIQIPKV